MPTRRQFLTSSVAAAATFVLGNDTCELPQTALEGIFTDRFTYRQGETIRVYAALQTPQIALVSLYRYDSSSVLEGSISVFIGSTGRTDNVWVDGAGFDLVAEFSTSSLPPGLYSVKIPLEAIQPENRLNDANGFPSRNELAVFCVTPATPGSHSRILYVYDTMTGVPYGSYGGHSIYGPDLSVREVSWIRPGLGRAASHWPVWPLTRVLRELGYEFEYADPFFLDRAPSEYLLEYDLIVFIGQFEYLPHNVMQKLLGFLNDGGNLFTASHEFAVFRVRLDHLRRRLTTYKWNFGALDPLFGSGSPHVAGVGMNIPETVYETEITGQTLWAVNNIPGEDLDLPLYNTDQIGWILDGTGLGEGDVLPAAFKGFATGQRLRFDNGQPSIVDPEATRTDPSTVIWGAVPSPDGRRWWESNLNNHHDEWPLLEDGFATCAVQERASGSRVVTLPSPMLIRNHLDDPLYRTIVDNIMRELSG